MFGEGNRLVAEFYVGKVAVTKQLVTHSQSSVNLIVDDKTTKINVRKYWNCSNVLHLNAIKFRI